MTKCLLLALTVLFSSFTFALEDKLLLTLRSDSDGNVHRMYATVNDDNNLVSIKVVTDFDSSRADKTVSTTIDKINSKDGGTVFKTAGFKMMRLKATSVVSASEGGEMELIYITDAAVWSLTKPTDTTTLTISRSGSKWFLLDSNQEVRNTAFLQTTQKQFLGAVRAVGLDSVLSERGGFQI